MAVHDDVDVVLFHDAQVGLGLERVGCAEQDVLQVGGQHGTAPAVGQRSPGALFDEVFVVLVDAHVGAVHDLDDFTVDIARFARQIFSTSRRVARAPVSGIAIHLRLYPIH
jgi:hypothetical protein